jgi:hypothetical protein
MFDDEEDEVLRELDVYISDNLDLFLAQFPLKPVYADPIAINSAKCKPFHNKFELEVPYSKAVISTFDANKNSVSSQLLTSSVVAQRTSLGAGVIKDNIMYITPISSVVQFRPSFKNIQSREIIEDEEEIHSEVVKGSEELKQVQLKRKETERAQSTRVQSYSHIQSQEELEPWQKLAVYDIGSNNFVV